MVFSTFLEKIKNTCRFIFLSQFLFYLVISGGIILYQSGVAASEYMHFGDIYNRLAFDDSGRPATQP